MKNPYFSAKIHFIISLLFSIFVSHSALAVVQAAPVAHDLIMGQGPDMHSLEPRTKAPLDYPELIDSLYTWLTGDSKECRAVKAQIDDKQLSIIRSFLAREKQRDLYDLLVLILVACLLPGESDDEQKRAVKPFIGKFLDYYAACENLDGDLLEAYEIILESYKICSVETGS